MRFELIGFRDGWDSIEASWLDLFERAIRPCIFYHPLFLRSSRALLEDRPTHLYLGYSGPQLVLGAPVRRSHPLPGVTELELHSSRILGFDHLAPLDTSPGRTATRAFLESGSFSCLMGTGLDAEFASLCEDALLETFRRDTFGCPWLELPSDPDDLAPRSKKLRTTLRQMTRKAGDEGVTFRVLTGARPGRTLLHALEDLLRLHGARAAARGRPSKFLRPQAVAFHTELCANAASFPGVVLFCEAVHEGQVKGSLYGFLGGGRFHFYQHGFDPVLADLSPGSLLIRETMRHAIGRGATVFDFLRGKDAYKARWTGTATYDCVLYGSPGSPFGRLRTGLLRWRRARRRLGKKAGTLAWLRGCD